MRVSSALSVLHTVMLPTPVPVGDPTTAPAPSVPPLRVLTVGDGNLSFSLALLRLHCPTKRERARLRSSPSAASSAVPPLSAAPSSDAAPSVRLVCSVFDSESECAAKYPETGQGVVDELRRRGAEVLFNVDATAILPTIRTERTRQAARSEGQDSDASAAAAAAAAAPGGAMGGARCVAEALSEFDVVIFHHPHSGREDVVYHRRLLSHFFHSAASVSHRSSLLLLSLCDRQPWQWQLHASAERHGWRVCDLGGWEDEMALWAALGYESKRHHTGKQFNSRHVSRRHKITLCRPGSHTGLAAAVAAAGGAAALEENSSQQLQQPPQSLCDRFPLLLGAARPYTSEQWQSMTQKSEEAAVEEEAGPLLDAPCCPICGQPHSESSSSYTVQPLPAEEGRVACERCHVTFANLRALQQHSAAMASRDDHIALQRGEGKRTRHRKLREEGILTQAMRDRGDRRREKRAARRSHPNSGPQGMHPAGGGTHVSSHERDGAVP